MEPTLSILRAGDGPVTIALERHRGRAFVRIAERGRSVVLQAGELAALVAALESMRVAVETPTVPMQPPTRSQDGGRPGAYGLASADGGLFNRKTFKSSFGFDPPTSPPSGEFDEFDGN